ncbi:unnamed protein product [Caenorhabditis sp. 36 PRJEB53466]|nr:unnamed protein product [Caenorhabditis sp. 36 PRJEB53466]
MNFVSRGYTTNLDPDLPCEEVREPFRTLPIRFINVPMDFRISFGALQRLLNDVKPKYVLAASAYTQPQNRRPDMQVRYEKLWPIEYDERVQLSRLSKNKQKMVTVEVHPEIVKNLDFKQHPLKKVAIASVACHLNAYDDKFKLVPAKVKVARRKLGRITAEKLMRLLRERHYTVNELKDLEESDKSEEEGELEEEEEKTKKIRTLKRRDPAETIMFVKELKVTISVRNNGSHTKISADSEEHRQKVLEIVRSMLWEDDGVVGRRSNRPPTPPPEEDSPLCTPSVFSSATLSSSSSAASTPTQQ